jgi:hypothetical protein
MICGPNYKELVTVKKCIKGILRLARHLYLEKDMVFLEISLRNSIYHNLRDK